MKFDLQYISIFQFTYYRFNPDKELSKQSIINFQGMLFEQREKSYLNFAFCILHFAFYSLRDSLLH